MNDKKIGLLGAGGQAVETFEYLSQLGFEIEFIAVNRDYQLSVSGNSLFRSKVAVLEELSDELYNVPVNCAVGAPGLRNRFVKEWNFNDYVNIIAPGAYVAEDIEIGVGNTFAPHVVVASQVKIGSHVLVNLAATISHDCEIGSFCTIGPGVNIGGDVSVGQGTVIGIGATIKHGVNIGSHSYIGAGALVLRDVEDNTVVYGSPAKFQKERLGWIDEL